MRKLFKNLIDKINQYFINRKIVKMMEGYLWSMNTSQTREGIRIRLNKIVDTELTDVSTTNEIDNGSMTFSGYSEKRKKVINITINTRG
jgi:hypothetical protein